MNPTRTEICSLHVKYVCERIDERTGMFVLTSYRLTCCQSIDILRITLVCIVA